MAAPAVLIDEFITAQVRGIRFSTNLAGIVLAKLDKVSRSLVARLLEYDPSELKSYAGRQRRLTELRTATATYLRRQFSQIDDATMEGAVQLAQLDTELVANLVTRTTGAGKGLAVLPFPLARVRAIAERALILGAPSSEWWSRQNAQVLNRFVDTVNQGMAAGDSTTAIARVVREQMGIIQRNAEALVRSSVLSVNNTVRKAQLDEAKLVDAVQVLTAFDSRVCKICIPLAGASFDKKTLEPLPESPYQGKLPAPNPPFHWNCRCIFIPVLRGEKADTDIGFEDWLVQQSTAKQNKILGPKRAELWRSGKMSMTDLVDQRGRPMTLAQIRAEIE